MCHRKGKSSHHSHENHDFDILSTIGDFGVVGVDVFELEDEFFEDELFFPSFSSSTKDVCSAASLILITLVLVSRCISYS